MTPRQFHKAVSRSTLGPKAREAAYSVLVEGGSINGAATRVGVSRASVYRWVARVQKLHKEAKQ